MTEHLSLILTIIGAVFTYTVSIIAFANWLSGKFRALEKLIYSETQKHRRENDEELEDHALRIQRLELKVFEFTVTGPSTRPDRSVVDQPTRHRGAKPTNSVD